MADSCQKIQAQLLEHTAPSALSATQRAHLQGCNACQALWSSHRSALAMGATMQKRREAATTQTSDAFFARLEARRGQGDKPGQRTGWFPWLLPVAGVAAVVALLVWLQSPAPSSIPRERAVAQRSTQPPPQRRAHELALQTLMAQAFSSMVQSTKLSPPASVEERAAEALGDDLEQDAYHGLALAIRSTRELPMYDPAPISQKVPAPLSSVRTLVGMVMRREL